jgi:type II secretion system protein J
MRFRNPQPTREAGFTLIEILTAVAILAVVSAIVSVSFATTLRLREAALREAEREHGARNALRLLADELMVGLVHSKGRWLGRTAEVDGRPADLLIFNTGTQPPSRTAAPEGDIAMVAYTREKDRLVRYSLRNLHALTPDAVDRTFIAAGVLAFNVRYFEQRAGVWLDQWAEDPKAAMPPGVLIELTMTGEQSAPRTYKAWVPTPRLAPAQKAQAAPLGTR